VEREEEIFRRKVEMKMTRELAIKAQEDNVQFKQEFARDAKEEAVRQKQIHEMEQAALLEENRVLVKVIEDQNNNKKKNYSFNKYDTTTYLYSNIYHTSK